MTVNRKILVKYSLEFRKKNCTYLDHAQIDDVKQIWCKKYKKVDYDLDPGVYFLTRNFLTRFLTHLFAFLTHFFFIFSTNIFNTFLMAFLTRLFFTHILL